jgi:hypothetical protein
MIELEREVGVDNAVERCQVLIIGGCHFSTYLRLYSVVAIHLPMIAIQEFSSIIFLKTRLQRAVDRGGRHVSTHP